jgi:hypothetical protein
MNAPTPRWSCASDASIQSPFEADVTAAEAPSPNAAIRRSVRDSRCHLVVGGIDDAAVVDFDGAHAVVTCRKQRLALRSHLFEGHVRRGRFRFRGLVAQTEALNSCPV